MIPTLRRILLPPLILLCMLGGIAPMQDELRFLAVAWAQDDDGDDDDGGSADDDSDDGDGQSGGDDDGDDNNEIQRSDRDGKELPTRRSSEGRIRAPAPPVVRELPAFAPEIVVTGLSPSDLEALFTEGFRQIDSFALLTAQTTLYRLQPPAGVPLESARDRVRALPTGRDADLNHFYRTGQAVSVASTSPPLDCRHSNCQAHDLVSWSDDAYRAMHCPVTMTIGVIDTGVNADHDLLERDSIELQKLTPVGADASGMVHGTAVVSVLAGKAGSRISGLLPDAKLLVVDVFTREGQDERADVASIVRGLDLMEGRGIRIVNLSLAGPDNSVLKKTVKRLVEEKHMLLVAAVGNGGAERPVAFPAAYDGVIAVTAVDVRGRVFRSAQRGTEVDIAAPGVGLLLATSVKGAREKSGTSFAVPFVAAAGALILSNEPELSPEEVLFKLATSARDSGAAGHDKTFGHGILDASGLCS